MFPTSRECECLYVQLMDQLKRINSDWLSLRHSRQYKWGLVLSEVYQDLTRMRMGNLLKSIGRWCKGRSSASVKSVNAICTDISCGVNYFSNERIAVYSAIFGSYDTLTEPYARPDNCDYYIITDQKIPATSIWKPMPIVPEMEGMSPAWKNRFAKMHPHRFFPQYKYSVYVDGNVQVITDMTEYINRVGSVGIAIHGHRDRACVYEELKAVVKTKRMTRAEATRYSNFLEAEGMPKGYGLLQCSVIVRENANPDCIRIMEDWWRMYTAYGKRDQLYLPYVLFKNGIPTADIACLGHDLYSNPSFRVLNHI